MFSKIPTVTKAIIQFHERYPISSPQSQLVGASGIEVMNDHENIAGSCAIPSVLHPLIGHGSRLHMDW